MITAEQLGFTKEELQERVINKLCEDLLNDVCADADGEDCWRTSKFCQMLDARIKERIDGAVASIADAHVLPNVDEYIRKLTIPTTNVYGEPKGEPVTFIEYLTRKAESYMTEQVDYNGKPKSASDSYSWRASQTRLAHMIHEHLHYHIDTAMKAALKEANSTIAKGLQETVKIKLEEIAKALQVSVQTK